MTKMNKENPITKADAEKEKNVTKFIESVIKDSRFADAGNEGLIYRLDKQQLPEGFSDFLESNGIRIEGDIASKILKVYTRGQGATEFKALEKASKLLDSYSDKTGLAKVPKPIFLREIPVTQSLKESLGQKAEEIVGDKIEVILMDYIEGDDLATALYKKALEIIQGNDFDPKIIEGMDYQSLARYVQDEFTQKTHKSVQREESPMGDDMNWLRKFLKDNGFSPDSSIAAQIKKTVELMDKKGMSHGDIHPRNIKIHNSQVYLLDFGKADGSWDLMSEEEKNERIGDGVLLDWVRGFSETPKKQFEKRVNEYMHILEKVSAKTKVSARFESIKSELIKDSYSKLSEMFERLNMTDDAIDEFCSYIYRLVKEHPETRVDVLRFEKDAISRSSGSIASKLQILSESIVGT